MVVEIRDCSETECVYGYIVMRTEKVSPEDIQNALSEIKADFNAEEDADWTVDDTIFQLSFRHPDWDFSYSRNNSYSVFI